MPSFRETSAWDNPSSSRLRSFFPRSIIALSLSLFSTDAMSVRLSFCTL